MTKATALHNFFSSFGLTCYPSDNVPADTVFPWLTYSPSFGGFGDGDTNCTVDLWYYTESESVPNAMVEKISKTIGQGGIVLSCDNGAMWLKRGTPFCNSLSAQEDHNIKRRQLNITIEFFTE